MAQRPGFPVWSPVAWASGASCFSGSTLSPGLASVFSLPAAGVSGAFCSSSAGVSSCFGSCSSGWSAGLSRVSAPSNPIHEGVNRGLGLLLQTGGILFHWFLLSPPGLAACISSVRGLGRLAQKKQKDAKAGIIPSSGVLRSSLLFHFELRQISGDLLPHEDCGPPLPPALAAVYRRPIQNRVSRHLLDTLMAFGAGVPSMYYHWPNHPYSMPPQRER